LCRHKVFFLVALIAFVAAFECSDSSAGQNSSVLTKKSAPDAEV
jgi:hypothetical protein